MCYNVITVKDRTQKLRKRLIFMMKVHALVASVVSAISVGMAFDEVEAIVLAIASDDCAISAPSDVEFGEIVVGEEWGYQAVILFDDEDKVESIDIYDEED
jgi:hypothetical protein